MNIATAMVDAFRRFISDVPRHLREADVVEAIMAHAGVIPQRVLVRNSTGTSNSCYGIAHFSSAADAAWLTSIGMRWEDGTVSDVRP